MPTFEEDQLVKTVLLVPLPEMSVTLIVPDPSQQKAPRDEEETLIPLRAHAQD